MFKLAVRYSNFTETPEEILQGGFPDIGDVIEVSSETLVWDILEQIVRKFHSPERMVVLTPIRDRELNMTLFEWVENSDGDTRLEHERYKRHRSVDGKICVQFYRRPKSMSPTDKIKITLYNRNEVEQSNLTYTL